MSFFCSAIVKHEKVFTVLALAGGESAGYASSSSPAASASASSVGTPSSVQSR